MLTVSLFWSFSFRRGFVVHRLWLVSFFAFFPSFFSLFCFGSSFHWKSNSRRSNKSRDISSQQPNAQCPLEVIQRFNEIHVLLFFIIYRSWNIIFLFISRDLLGEIFVRCFQPVCYSRLFSPFNSTPKTQKRVQLKFFYLLLRAFVEREFPREIFYRGAMERQERKLSPSSNIRADLTAGVNLTTAGNRDSVESNRLGQWRSRLASANCISDAARCSRRRADWLFIRALRHSNWFRWSLRLRSAINWPFWCFRHR